MIHHKRALDAIEAVSVKYIDALTLPMPGF